MSGTSTIGLITIGMKVGTAGLSKGLAAASGMLAGFTKGINAVNPAILGFAGNIAKPVVNALTSLATDGFDRVDAANDLAARLGTTTQALTRLQYVATLTGSTTEDLNNALTKMNANLGNGGSHDSIRALGLDVETLVSQDPADAFKAIAGAIGAIESPSKKAALAMDIFGKGGVQILTTLSTMPEEFDKLSANADKLGFSFDAIAGEKVGAVKDSFDNLKIASEGLGNTLAIEVAPYLTNIINSFLEWATTSQNTTTSVNVGMGYVVKGIGIVADVVHTLKLGFDFMQVGTTAAIGLIVKGLAYLADGIAWVINLLPGMKVSFSDTLHSMGDDLLKLADKQGAAFNEAFIAKAPSEKINQWFTQINNAPPPVPKTAVKTLTDMENATLKTITGVKNLEASLKTSIQTWGMSSDQVAIYKLKQEGATHDMLANVTALNEQLSALKKNKDAQEALGERAKSVFDSAKTPLMHYREELLNLNDLLDKGVIKKDVYDRAKHNAMKSFMGNGIPLASAMELGSQSAREVQLRHLFQSDQTTDPIKEVAKQTKESAKQGKAAVDWLKKLSDKQDQQQQTITVIF